MAERPRLVAVTDVSRLTMTVEAWASSLFTGGVDIVQVREAGISLGELEQLTRRVMSVAPSPSFVQINGFPDVARYLGCGVHLPERSGVDPNLPSPSSRSVHSPESASFSESFEFLVAGHVFSTSSHPEAPGRGLHWLSEVVAAAPVPVVAIGGIDAANAGECIRAGASGVAVIRAFCATPDSLHAARELRASLDDASQILTNR